MVNPGILLLHMCGCDHNHPTKPQSPYASVEHETRDKAHLDLDQVARSLTNLFLNIFIDPQV